MPQFGIFLKKLPYRIFANIEHLNFKEKNGVSIPHPDSKEWHTKEAEQKAKDRNLFWAAPYDARFPQVRKTK